MHAQVAVFHRPTRPAPATLFSASLAFSLLHVLTAAEVKRWAKKRQDLGLGGTSPLWDVSPSSACYAVCFVGLACPDLLQGACTLTQVLWQLLLLPTHPPLLPGPAPQCWRAALRAAA